MRTVWGDDRLGDLSGKVDDLRSELRSEAASLRGEMNALRVETTTMRTEMNARFDSMQRSVLTMTGTTLATMVVGFASILATQL